MFINKTGKNIKLFLTPDGDGPVEIIRLASIAINGNVYRSITIADIFAYEMSLDAAADKAGIVDYDGVIEQDHVDYFMVENISKWKRDLDNDERYDYYVKIGGLVLLSLVVVILIGLLYKYYFVGYNKENKDLSSESDPLLNNINVQTK